MTFNQEETNAVAGNYSSSYHLIMANGGTTAVLDEILEPVTQAFSREVAEALVRVKASDSVQAQITELAEKCSEGRLTADERSRYESYVNAVDLISLLQAKARVWLLRHASPS
jgi:hypothetical protein